MKEVNLLSIIEAFNNLNSPLLIKYLDYFKISSREAEFQDLESFTILLQKHTQKTDSFDKFFFGYTIPQISKEFDLLRFGENYTVNIELKNSSTIEKIKKQLIRNKYYLSFLNVDVFNFTFVVDEQKLYRLDNGNQLIEGKFEELSEILHKQNVKEIINVDNLFNPSNYLVSPFNSTDKFIGNKYFLTSQQEDIKQNTLNKISRNKSAFISISGKAGSGKTLLIYDIVKEYRLKNTNVLIVHIGNLNDGHRKLRDEFKWKIIPIKHLMGEELSNYSLVIIDEAQRISVPQLDFIIEGVKKFKKNCIFSYDMEQCLRKGEIANNIEEQIKSKANPDFFQLTTKIRTNKEIASFVSGILDKSKRTEVVYKSNIELNYFKTYSEATNYIKYLNENNWKVINFTPSTRQIFPYQNFSISDEDNAHEVIGQEFDKVIAVVDSHFYYDSNNKLSTKGYSSIPYYHPTKMLSQIMTRTRRKLSFIVIDNEEIMDRCLEMLNPN